MLDISISDRIRPRLFAYVHGVPQCATEGISLFIVYYIFRGVSSALLHGCYRNAFLVWVVVALIACRYAEKIPS